MLYDCKFNPDTDIAATDPYGFINLNEAYVNHNVPTTIADEIINYNGIDDPESIIGTPKDIFEGYRMRDAILAADKKANQSSVTATAAAE